MPEIAREVRVPKNTGTHADVLAAVGLGEILAEALGSREAVTILDEGPAFLLRAIRPVTERDILGLRAGAGYPFLKTKGSPPASVSDVLDYGVEKARFDRWRGERQALKKAAKGESEIAEILADLAPRPDWRHWQVVNTLQGDGATNAMAVAATDAGFPSEMVAALRDFVASGKSGAPWKVSLVQIFSPTAGKGYSRLKPDSTARNALPDHWCDPLLEWARHRGYFSAAAPQFMGDDIRIFTPVPAEISIAHLHLITARLNAQYLPGDVRPKRDALAALVVARLLIEHSDLRGGPVPLAKRRLNRIISGLTVAHYQSLGQAKALSETGAIGIPGWFEIADGPAADQLLESLEEHRSVISGLRDDHSDEIGLLGTYRRFLEMRGDNAVDALLDFAAAYGHFALRIRAQNQKRRPFQLRARNLERLIMSTVPRYGVILKDAGLRAVADAIRNSTVLAQYWKSKGQDHREVRYDILPDLRRKRLLSRGAFLEALSDFIVAYNAENARRREMGKPAPGSVTDVEFGAIATLIDEHGASLIGAMVCALGTCRQDRGGEE
jgi:hypothetical protein